MPDVQPREESPVPAPTRAACMPVEDAPTAGPLVVRPLSIDGWGRTDFQSVPRLATPPTRQSKLDAALERFPVGWLTGLWDGLEIRPTTVGSLPGRTALVVVRLQHPNIVHPSGVGSPFLSQEYVEGPSLASRLDGQRRGAEAVERGRRS
jgi:hypothetical protein